MYVASDLDTSTNTLCTYVTLKAMQLLVHVLSKALAQLEHLTFLVMQTHTENPQQQINNFLAS